MPRTADFDSQRLAGLARKQHSVITRAQALDSGMTNPVIHYRLRDAGPWQVLLPGVYLTHTGQPDDESRDLAALLYAGPDRSRAGGLQVRVGLEKRAQDRIVRAEGLSRG